MEEATVPDEAVFLFKARNLLRPEQITAKRRPTEEPPLLPKEESIEN